MKLIRYSFKFCGPQPMDEPWISYEYTIYPEGRIVRKRLADEKVTSRRYFHVSPEEVSTLLERVKANEGGPNQLCDAMDAAQIVNDDGTIIGFDPSPVCLSVFIDTLGHRR